VVLATCIAAAGCVEAAGDFRNAPAAHHFATAPYPRQKKTVEGLVMSQSIDLCTSLGNSRKAMVENRFVLVIFPLGKADKQQVV